jgi:hypothetical protein
VEAKVQSLYKYSDLIEAMMDPGCLLIGKIRLGFFFYHAMVEVEMKLPNLGQAQCVWDFLAYSLDVLKLGIVHLDTAEKYGWGSPSTPQQACEFLLVCIRIVRGYFKVYYTSDIFSQERSEEHYGLSKVTLKKDEALELMRKLAEALKTIHKEAFTCLRVSHHRLIEGAIAAIRRGLQRDSADADAQWVDYDERLELDPQLTSFGELTPAAPQLRVSSGKGLGLIHSTSAKLLRKSYFGNSSRDSNFLTGGSSAERSSRRLSISIASKTQHRLLEHKLIYEDPKIGAKLAEFNAILLHPEFLAYEEKEQYSVMANLLLSIPRLSDVSANSSGGPAGRVRFEPLIARLAGHVRRSITVTVRGLETTKSLTEESTRTSIWLLSVFRTLIEKTWGMSIEQRTEDGDDDQDRAVAGLFAAFTACEVPFLCLDLLAKGIDEELQVCQMSDPQRVNGF